MRDSKRTEQGQKWREKRYRDLSPTQKRIYDREAKRKSRQANREKDRLYMRQYMRNRRKKERAVAPLDGAASG